MPYWEARGRAIVDGPIPRVMGIVNVTPDSFSDGGRFAAVDAALAHALELVEQGADILDIGGESSRPGSAPVPLEEELRRALPVIEALAPRVSVPISIDTTKAEVARQALAAGAAIINDISALEGDPAMAVLAAETGAAVVLMHMQGVPATMQDDPRYDDVCAEVRDYLARRIEWTVGQGVPRARIAIDPGIGFGKRNQHNLDLLRNLGPLTALGCAVLIGTSRKGVLGKLVDRPPSGLSVASATSALAACAQGASVVRVHDVAATVDAIKVWTVLHGWPGSVEGTTVN